MPKKYNLIFSVAAQNDLKEIFAYISAEYPQIAEKILDKIEAKANSLVVFPQKGRIVPELLTYNNIREYRELQEYPWRIIYQASDGKITVHAVLDGRRNIKDLLAKKFLHKLP
ncbi:MAG: type II toxin-antitoxin system RelE/ParE family toxin [Candidatus Margulisbacteria bacterium]|jgi:toxin ParE1/3/4|nr:type II toxin-antitoxin system RelE/ParE family toxin [Candidatus Margulisiibacteriota bacterium]